MEATAIVGSILPVGDAIDAIIGMSRQGLDLASATT